MLLAEELYALDDVVGGLLAPGVDVAGGELLAVGLNFSWNKDTSRKLSAVWIFRIFKSISASGSWLSEVLLYDFGAEQGLHNSPHGEINKKSEPQSMVA